MLNWFARLAEKTANLVQLMAPVEAKTPLEMYMQHQNLNIQLNELPEPIQLRTLW